MRIAAARVFVRDLEAAAGFYEGALGLRVSARGSDPGFVVFGSGPVDLVVEQVAADAPAEDQALVGRFTGLSFAVDDLDACFAALQQQGVVFSGAPETQPWGGRLATLNDPAGNQLQLVEYPSRR